MAIRREVPSTARCSYEVLPLVSGNRADVDQLNAQGAKGATPFFQTLLDNEGTKRVYVRDTLQQSAFGYYIDCSDSTMPQRPAGGIERSSGMHWGPRLFTSRVAAPPAPS